MIDLFGLEQQPKRHHDKPKTAAPVNSRINGLLPKQAKFVAEYLICGNATQAAIHAGYSAKTAGVIGAQNLKKPNIASLLAQKQVIIAKRQDERLEAMELTQECVNREVAHISFFDPRKMFAADGRPLAITELDDDTAACIIGLDVLESYEGSNYACRHCYDLKYKSTRSAPNSKHFARANEVRARLGWGGGVASPMRNRKKGTHAETYLRLLTQLVAYSIAALQGTDQLAAKITSRLDKITSMRGSLGRR